MRRSLVLSFFCLILVFTRIESMAQLTMSQISNPLVNFLPEIDLDEIYPIRAVVHNVGPTQLSSNELYVNFALQTYSSVTGSQPIIFQTQSYGNPVIPPGDTLGVPLNFSLSSSFYFAYGGGNTIIVWPSMIGYPTLDSLEVPIYIIPFSGQEELNENKQQPILYPNPLTEGYLTITGVEGITSVQVMDISGREILNICNDDIPVVPKPIQPGAYIIHIQDYKGNSWTRKIIVK